MNWIRAMSLPCACLLGYSSVTLATPLGTPAACKAYSGLPPSWQQTVHAGMLPIAGGEFMLGTNVGYREERIEVKTHVNSFWIDQTEVTVAQFADFVQATAYVTDAEREGGGVLFRVPAPEQLQQQQFPWWVYQKGADWRHPQGPGSKAEPNHPVTLVTQADAKAYAQWLGHELPTEAEWEYAAKAQRQDGDMEKEPRDAHGKPQANFWQGHFPLHNTAEDGYPAIAPVGCYAANPLGLYDMIGNVWEQTQDDYTPGHELYPQDTTTQAAIAQPQRAQVIKGGSFLCAQDYCVRYRPSAREAHEANLPLAHLGFRTVWHATVAAEDWWTRLWQ